MTSNEEEEHLYEVLTEIDESALEMSADGGIVPEKLMGYLRYFISSHPRAFKREESNYENNSRDGFFASRKIISKTVKYTANIGRYSVLLMKIADDSIAKDRALLKETITSHYHAEDYVFTLLGGEVAASFAYSSYVNDTLMSSLAFQGKTGNVKPKVLFEYLEHKLNPAKKEAVND